MSKGANYAVDLDETNDKRLVLRDLGPHDLFLTITNDAENVIRKEFGNLKGRELYYYDSEGELTRLLVGTDGTFLGFSNP